MHVLAAIDFFSLFSLENALIYTFLLPAYLRVFVQCSLALPFFHALKLRDAFCFHSFFAQLAQFVYFNYALRHELCSLIRWLYYFILTLSLSMKDLCALWRNST